MSKKKSKAESVVLLQGPLGPWRFSIAVLVSALTSGMTLYRAALTGIDLDMALGRSFGVAFVTWFLLGSINKMLAVAEARGAATDESLDGEEEPSTH